MSRWVLTFAIMSALLGCSTRSVVVKPEDVGKLNDLQWTIKAEPAVRPR